MFTPHFCRVAALITVLRAFQRFLEALRDFRKNLIRNGQGSAEKFSEPFPLSLLPLYPSASIVQPTSFEGYAIDYVADASIFGRTPRLRTPFSPLLSKQCQKCLSNTPLVSSTFHLSRLCLLPLCSLLFLCFLTSRSLNCAQR